MIDISTEIKLADFKNRVPDLLFLKAIGSKKILNEDDISKAADLLNVSEVLIVIRITRINKELINTIFKSLIPTPF